MSTLYQLTKTLHTLAQKKAKKHGLELVIKSDFMIDKNGEIYQNAEFMNGGMTKDLLPTIQEPQIRQILLAFKDVLGENPEKIELGFFAINFNIFGDKNDMKKWNKLSEVIEDLPKSQAEALCKKWLDGLSPLIDSDPEKVLEELKQILQSI